MLHSGRFVNRARSLAHRLRAFTSGASDEVHYDLLSQNDVPTNEGWQERTTAEQQHEAFKRLLAEARAGKPRLDFLAAARAIEATGIIDPLVLEVGCGSGYYCEILPLLLHRSVRYLGIDYSPAMIGLARDTYDAVPFVNADACRLPFASRSFDIVMNGTSLMHIVDYQEAIAESVRTSRGWCIFHTVPLIKKRKTTLLHKSAYGGRVVEVIFNREELESMFNTEGLTVETIFDSIPYDLSAVLGEQSWTSTYLCRKI